MHSRFLLFFIYLSVVRLGVEKYIFIFESLVLNNAVDFLHLHRDQCLETIDRFLVNPTAPLMCQT